MLRNLPLYYDDVKGKGITDEMLKLIFAVTLGRSKGRARPTGDTREVHEFRTMLTIVSNNSLVDYINEYDKASTAGLDRVFEIPVQPNLTGIGRIDRTDAQQAMGELAVNYGHAGVMYAEFLGKNIEAVEKAVYDAKKNLNKIVDGADAERFWVSTMAVCYVGAHIANRLRLTEINERKLLEFLITNFYRLRDVVGSSPTDIRKPETIERIIQHYLSDRAGMTLVTDTVPKGGGRPTPMIVNNSFDFRNGVRVRVATKDKLIRFSKSDFSHWLKTGPLKLGPHEIIKAAKEQLQLNILQVSLANGTNLEGYVREQVIEISNWVHFNTREAP